MKKTILYRLFKIGLIPKRIRPALEAEGVLVCDEGIGGWIFFKNYKAPGKRFIRKAAGFTGFLAVTEKRLLAHAYGKRIVNVPFDDPRLVRIDCRLIGPERIELSFESSVFHSDRSGQIRLRFHTSRARAFHDTIREAQKNAARL